LIAIKTGRPFYLNAQTTESMKPGYTKYGNVEIWVKLKEAQAQKWAEMTRNNVGKSLAIISDGRVMSYPRVQSEITGGAVAISGNYKIEEMQILTAIFKGGILECQVETWNFE